MDSDAEENLRHLESRAKASSERLRKIRSASERRLLIPSEAGNLPGGGEPRQSSVSRRLKTNISYNGLPLLKSKFCLFT